jgi:hypothetical protein
MGLEQYDDGKHFYGAFLARLDALFILRALSRILMAQTIMTYGHVSRLKVNYLSVNEMPAACVPYCPITKQMKYVWLCP